MLESTAIWLKVCLATIILASVAVTTATAAVGHTAGTRDTKPQTLTTSAVRTVFDCSGRDTLVLAPGLIDTLRGDTTGGPTLLGGYACRLWAEMGPEHVYRLEVSANLELWAALREVDPETDLDLFLLSDCDTDSCLTGQNIELAATLGPGTYFLVVDGFGTTATQNLGPYAVALETRAIGVPDEVCSGTIAEPVACGIGSLIERSGSLHGQPNLLNSYACNPFLARGGEAWFAVDLLPGQAVSAVTTTLADSLDAVLWLFDGCGEDAVCLAVGDDGIAGEDENLSWQSETPDPITVYLAIDCARPAATPTAGAYGLSISCGTEVPSRSSSFGGVRALYR